MSHKYAEIADEDAEAFMEDVSVELIMDPRFVLWVQYKQGNDKEGTYENMYVLPAEKISGKKLFERLRKIEIGLPENLEDMLL